MWLNVVDENNAPVDLTWGSVLFTISVWPNVTPELQKTCTIIDAVNGIAEISATPVEMDIEVGTYKWELQFTWPTWDISTTPMGEIEILSQLTQ